MKEMELRVVNCKVIFLSALVVIPVTFLIAIVAESIKYTVNQTYFIISCLALVGIINFVIIKKYSQLITFSFSDNSISIFEGREIRTISYSNIDNYNTYYLLVKKMGYMVRIKDSKNHFFWITWKNFEKKEKNDDENYEVLQRILASTGIPRKKETIDIFILLVASIPWAALGLGIITLLGIFYYVFFKI